MLAGGAAACGCSSPAVGPVSFGSSLAAGNIADLAVSSIRIVAGQPVCIARDAGGVYAMTLTCTHAGCDIGTTGMVTWQELVCGCHGSVFDADGKVLSGPATQPLDHFAVTIDSAGNLTIHGDQIVDASQRLSV